MLGIRKETNEPQAKLKWRVEHGTVDNNLKSYLQIEWKCFLLIRIEIFKEKSPTKYTNTLRSIVARQLYVCIFSFGNCVIVVCGLILGINIPVAKINLFHFNYISIYIIIVNYVANWFYSNWNDIFVFL